MSKSKQLYRIPEKGKVTGLSAGLAEYFATDVTIVRILWVLAIFVIDLPWVVVSYFVIALIVPTKETANDKATLSARIDSFVKEVTKNSQTDWVRNSVGIALLAIGVWYLVTALWPDLFDINWYIVWPALLIVAGVMILIDERKR